MRTQPSMISLPMLLVSPVQAIGGPSSNAAFAGAPMTVGGVLAQLEAPIGHRQPTLDDLPEWLREEEKPGAEANPTPAPEADTADVDQEDQRHGQRRKSRMRPDDSVPRICDPC
jgi:hypothetical protein